MLSAKSDTRQLLEKSVKRNSKDFVGRDSTKFSSLYLPTYERRPIAASATLGLAVNRQLDWARPVGMADAWHEQPDRPKSENIEIQILLRREIARTTRIAL